MAHARTPRETCNLRKRISRTNEEGRRTVCSLRHLEGSVLCCICSVSGRSVRSVLRPVWADGSARPHDYSNGAETGLLLPVALCPAVIASSFFGDPISTDWPCAGDHRFASSAVSLWGGRKELAAQADCGSNRPADRNNTGHIYASRWIHTVESAHECVERRSNARTVSAPQHRLGTARRTGLSGEAMPQLPFSGRLGRSERACAGQRRCATHARPTHPPSDSGRGQHASIREKFNSRRDYRAGRLS